MRIPRVDYEDMGGLFDKVVGLGKELAGEVLDNDSMIEAGEAQQKKGTEQLRAVRQQAKADVHKAKARAQETRQRSVQESKTG